MADGTYPRNSMVVPDNSQQVTGPAQRRPHRVDSGNGQAEIPTSSQAFRREAIRQGLRKANFFRQQVDRGLRCAERIEILPSGTVRWPKAGYGRFPKSNQETASGSVSIGVGGAADGVRLRRGSPRWSDRHIDRLSRIPEARLSANGGLIGPSKPPREGSRRTPDARRGGGRRRGLDSSVQRRHGGRMESYESASSCRAGLSFSRIPRGRPTMTVARTRSPS